MSEGLARHLRLPEVENISGTLPPPAPAVTPHRTPAAAAASSLDGCSYIAAAAWRYGEPAPFCEAPRAPGSSYCARHRALCRAPAGSAAAAAVLAAQERAAAEAPPRRLGGQELGPPEPPLATEPEEAMAALDLPRAAAAEPA